MNKVYRKIWSLALNQLVVVSELASCPRSGGKRQRAVGHSPVQSLVPKILTLLAAMGGAGWVLPAHAQAVDCNPSPYNAYNGTASCMGFGATASGVGATALGSISQATVLGALAVGYASQSTAQNGIALGFQAKSAAINSIYIGARTAPSTGALAGGDIGIGTDVTASGGNSMAFGTQTVSSGSNAIAFGIIAHATAPSSIAQGDGASSASTSSVAIGTHSSADVNSANSVVIGSVSKAVGALNAVALGTSAQVNNGQATALGGFTNATGDGATAVGLSSQSLFSHATAVGWQAYATALNAIYLGARTTGTGASAESAIAIGTDVTASGTESIGIGLQANASQGNAIAIGRQAIATGLDSMYIGPLPDTAGRGATATNAIGVGVDVTASGVGSVGLGNFTVASGGNSVALGASTASANNAVSAGQGSAASGGNSLALGFTSKAQAASTIAFGDTNTVAAAAGPGSIAGGHNSQVTGGTGAVALGQGQVANGNGAVAIGDPNSVNGNGAVGMGANNTVNGDGAVGIGNTNNAQGVGSVALGNTSSALAAGAVAFGNGAIANNANDVALGSGSTTAAAVGTPSTTINGTTYNFVGTTPTSTISVGAAGTERTITNVAAGRISGSSTDAINGSQLFATNQALGTVGTGITNLGNTVTNLGNSVANSYGGSTTYDPTTGTINTGITYGGNTFNTLQQVFDQIGTGATHYYSVNDGGTAGGNFANDGASGLNSLAAGVGATAQADSGTSLGQNTQTTVLGGVALGSGAVSNRAIAPTSGSILVGTNVIPFNTTDRNLLGAVSVGNATDFRQVTNVADGTEDQDAVTLRQLKGAMSSFSVTPIKYFHANSTAADSLAVGAESVAIGPQTTVNGDNGIGMGNGAIVQQTAPGGTAIGQNATVNLADGVALGTNATSNGIQAMALGAGTQAAFAGSVALGAGAVTAAPVATANTTINGNTYNFAGTTPGSTVSVGAVGAERTVTNVAAGRIDGGSTDAINGSQLFAANQAIGTVGTSVTNLGNTVTNLGNSLANSYGGATTYDPTTGTINTSITYGGNTFSTLQQVFNQIDTGGIKYFHANSNLADSLATGLNSVAIGPVSTAGTENSVSIGNGATAGTNVGDVALGAGSTTGTVTPTAGTTIAGNNYAYAGTTPTSTVSVGTSGNERTITNVAAGQVNGNSTDAINGSQLFATDQALETLNNTVTANATHYYSVNDGGTPGGNFANDGATGLNALAAGVGATAQADSGTSLGQNTQTTVLGGVALGSGAVSDRAIAPTSGSILVGTNVIPFNTTDRNLLGSVSVGNATDFRQITNVADGTEDQDAVTLRQLKGAMSSFSVTPIKYFHANSTAADSLAAGAESVAIGPETTVNGDNGIGMGNGAIVQQTAPGGTAIGQTATVNLADGVALGTNATSNGIQAMALGAGTQAAFAGSVALGAGSVTDAPVGTTGATLFGTSYTFAGATPGSTVSVGAVGAERTITNVAAGRVSGSSTDAINGSQLFATNQTLEQLGSQIINLSNTINNFPPGGGSTTNSTYQTSTNNTSTASATGDNSTAAGAGSTASGNNSTAVGAGSTASGDNSVAIGAGSVANNNNTVSVGSAGHERTVTNVANGVNPTDAVNVGQLGDAINEAKSWSKDYVDQKFQSVDNDLNRIGNRANAGIAAAMAMASLPQAYQPNQSSAGAAVGSFHGETGVAVGVSTITESGRYVFKLNATTNSRGDAGAGIGAGVVW
ncbi:YadA-like family protein [Pinirhizobacter soli]|uniref:YadA-like family protein n=1 Tax=Pinirhizobacter soli TaxID=2786953 RepID=UPI00202A6DF0|nr:YadA-like family protein [Pinirhizobacter soli]